MWGATYSAEPANDIQLFHRCYSFITGSRAPLNHHALEMVTTGQWTPTDACMWVFDRAALITTGANAGRTVGEVNPQFSTDASDALNILRTFHFFHRRWFSNESLSTGFGFGTVVRLVEDLISPYEAANHISRILFTSSASYRELVTGVRSVIEIRENSNPLFAQTDTGSPYFNQLVTYQTQLPLAQIFHNWRVFLDPANQNVPTINAVSVLPSPPLLQLGRIRGFRPLTESEMDQTAVMAFTTDTSDSVGANYNNLFETTFFTEHVEAKIRRPYGGGVIGTNSYLTLNMDAGWRNQGFPRADGGARVWRRASRSIFHDFMCRTLPTLTAEDVEAFVRPTGTHPWQTSSSCMGCHAATDGMAGSMRNFSFNGDRNLKGVPVSFSPQPDLAADWATVIAHPTVIVDPSTKLRRMMRDGASVSYAAQESDLFGIDSDHTFFRRPPKGKILTRDYAGRLINQDVMGVDELGQKISEIDDFYACAASRYFNFFTGFEASLPDVPNASTQQVAARQFVLNLGQQLKQNQNLRSMIQSIIESHFFKEGIE
jgi:hypothetical protein